MKFTLKLIGWIAGIIILLCAGVWIGIEYQKTRVMHLRAFQVLIGCEKIDNKVGPEVQRCWGNKFFEQNKKPMY